jgi:hypothetical protein
LDQVVNLIINGNHLIVASAIALVGLFGSLIAKTGISVRLPVANMMISAANLLCLNVLTNRF